MQIAAGLPYWVDNTQYFEFAEASIIIGNTTSHFVISNCYFEGATGVKLDNVVNGKIEYCESYQGLRASGIRAYNVRDCIFSNNVLANYKDYGVYLVNGNNNTIMSNTIYFDLQDSIQSRTKAGIYLEEELLVNCRSNVIRNCRKGIELVQCSGGVHNHWVSENEVESCSDYGFSLQGCSNLPLVQNSINNCSRGVEIYECIALNFSSNSVSYNTVCGIWVKSGSNGCLLYDNDINNNGWSGITFELTENCIAMNNVINDNLGWGIIINSSNSTTLTDNTFSGNTSGDVGYDVPLIP